MVDYYAEKYGCKGSGTYNHNKLDSNIVGALGEAGASTWLA